MNMKKALLLILLSSSFIFAQNTCESKEEVIEDFNSITKCSIEQTKSGDSNKRQISVRISAPKTRFLKKRVIAKKEAATGLGDLTTSGVSNTNHQSNILNSIEVKENTAKNNIALLTNTLSADEVKKAVKFHETAKIPVFEACKNENRGNRLQCFNTQMVKHIEKHFHYPQEAVINKTEGKVWVRFIIDTNGNISNIKSLGPKGGEILNKEAERVVANLPKFIPGENDGKKVSVKYGFPISFSLDQD